MLSTGATNGPTHVLGADFAAPVHDRWFEDYPIGASHEYGYRSLDEAQILDFAREYDPQPFHLDPIAAAHGPFGDLVASGWQSCGVLMRLFADHVLCPASSLGSPGVTDLVWAVPVRPGDRLRLQVSVDVARASRSRPDRGMLSTTLRLLNQEDAVPVSMHAINFIRRRTV